MRRIRTVALGLLVASSLFAAGGKTCLDLSAQKDSDVSSPSGVRVTIQGYNHCSEDIDGNDCSFYVHAIGPNGKAIAKQYGRFGGSIGPYARVETKVFVVCDPERVRSITVEAQ